MYNSITLLSFLILGIHTITVTFIPKKRKYLSVTESKEITVKKRRPIVTWIPTTSKSSSSSSSTTSSSSLSSSLDEIEYGTLLNELMFSGINCELQDPTGLYNFSHSVGMLLEIGIHTIIVEYEPSKEDSLNYCRGYASYTFKVIGCSVPMKWEVAFDKEAYALYTTSYVNKDSENSSKDDIIYVAHTIPMGN